MQNLYVKIPEALHKRLVKEAQRRRITKSQLVRLALEDYLARERLPSRVTMLDIIGDLAGSCRGGPADLATNPKYMEDFGKDSMGHR